MTTTAPSLSTPSRTPLLAAVGVAVSLLSVTIATWVDITGNDDPANNHGMSDYLFGVGATVATALLAFGLVVRTAAAGNPARRSAILGVVAFLSNVVFWAGLPCVLGAAAVACALLAKDTGRWGGAAKTGMALGVVAFVPAVVLTIVG